MKISSLILALSALLLVACDSDGPTEPSSFERVNVRLTCSIDPIGTTSARAQTSARFDFENAVWKQLLLVLSNDSTSEILEQEPFTQQPDVSTVLVHEWGVLGTGNYRVEAILEFEALDGRDGEASDSCDFRIGGSSATSTTIFLGTETAEEVAAELDDDEVDQVAAEAEPE